MDRREFLKLSSLAAIAPAALLPEKAKANGDKRLPIYSPQGNNLPINPELLPYPFGAYVSHELHINISEETIKLSDDTEVVWVTYPIEGRLIIQYEAAEEVYSAFMHVVGTCLGASYGGFQEKIEFEVREIKKQMKERQEEVNEMDPSELFAETSIDILKTCVGGPVYKIRALDDDYRLCSVTYLGTG